VPIDERALLDPRQVIEHLSLLAQAENETKNPCPEALPLMAVTEKTKNIDRIRKLLAHCVGDGTTTEEANTAKLKAKKLMREYCISMDEVFGQRAGDKSEVGAPVHPSAPAPPSTCGARL
jgi:hypothetical protein